MNNSIPTPSLSPVSLGGGVVVGRFNAAHGVRGRIKLESFTEVPEKIFDYPLMVIQNEKQLHLIIESKTCINPSQWLLKLKGIDDRDQASQLTNLEITTELDQLEPLSQDTFYWHQLMGCEVSNQQGECLGRVDHLAATGANDVLVVQGRVKEYWIPYTDNVVLKVNIKERTILVDWDKDF